MCQSLIIKPFKSGSLIAQLVQNQPAMQETQVRFLGRKDPLENGKAIHSSIQTWRIPMDCTVHWVAKNWTGLSNFHFQKWINKFSPSSNLM